MRLLSFLAAFFVLSAVASAVPEYPAQGADIYDTQADASEQIASAQKIAKEQHKNILLMFGANWCVWCHRLHHTFESNPAVKTALEKNFVLVLVDVNTRKGVKRNDAVNTRYGNPRAQGLPALVVLDAEGTQLTTQETGALEDGKSAHDPEKVSAFLTKWAPKR